MLVHELGRAIVGGEFAPGDGLPIEDELVRHFKVSRSTFRDAMKTLASTGMVEIRPKTARAATEAQIGRIAAAFAAMGATIGDPAAHSEADRARDPAAAAAADRLLDTWHPDIAPIRQIAPRQALPRKVPA